MTILFFEKKSRQKKLQLSGSLCKFLIIYADRAFAKRQKKLRLSESLCRVFRLPCVKGAPPQAVRDCFFTLQPLRGFRTRLGDACKRASHTCKSLSHKGGLIKINSRRSRTASLRFSLFFFISKSRPERRLFSAHLFTATRCLLRAFRPLRVFRLLSARH